MNISHANRQQGFTLIELSIVLVIIGLIVGGVLVGQDLIKAAQIRATVSQIEKFDSAVNTFHGKYNGIPGDLASCTSFFTTNDCTTGAAAAVIAGDGVLTDFAGARLAITGEVAAFFHQLYKANLIAESISDYSAVSATAAAPLATTLPLAKLGNGNYIIGYTGDASITYPGMAGVNLYRITGISAIANTGKPTMALALTPLEAFQIDSKKDDGVANSGVVQGSDEVTAGDFNNAASDAPAAVSPTVCMSSAASYNTSTSNAVQNNRLCELLIRASF